MLKYENSEIAENLQESCNTEICECIFQNISDALHINLKMIQPIFPIRYQVIVF